MPGDHAEARARRGLPPSASKSICMPTQMPRNGRPEATAECTTRSSAAARSASQARAERSDARAAPRRQPRRSARVGGEHGASAPTCSQRLLRRPEVADAVVEHGDSGRSPSLVLARFDHRRAMGILRRACGQRGHRTPLVLGTAAPSTRTASRRQRATPLNVASMMWWTLRPRRSVTCSVMPAAVANDADGVLGQARVERRVAERDGLGQLDLPHARTGGRTGRAPPPPAPRRAGTGRWRTGARRPCRPAPPGTPRRARWPCPRPCGGCRREVAGGLDGQVEAAVAAELVEHVVVERAARC